MCILSQEFSSSFKLVYSAAYWTLHLGSPEVLTPYSACPKSNPQSSSPGLVLCPDSFSWWMAPSFISQEICQPRSLPLLQTPYLIHHQAPLVLPHECFLQCTKSSSFPSPHHVNLLYCPHQQVYPRLLCILSNSFFIMQPSDYFTPWRIPWTVWSMGSQRVRYDLATFTFKTAEKKKCPCLELHTEAFVNEVVWCLRFTLKYSRKSNGQEKDQTRCSMLITIEAGLWAQRGSILLFFLIWGMFGVFNNKKSTHAHNTNVVMLRLDLKATTYCFQYL